MPYRRRWAAYDCNGHSEIQSDSQDMRNVQIIEIAHVIFRWTELLKKRKILRRKVGLSGPDSPWNPGRKSKNKSTWSLWWKWCKTLLNHLTSLRHDDVIRTIEWRHGSFLIRGNLQIGNMNVSHVNGFEKYGSLIDMNGPWWRHRRWWRHRINQEEVELGRSDFPGGWHSRSSPWPAWTKPHLEFNVPAPQSQKNLNF